MESKFNYAGNNYYSNINRLHRYLQRRQPGYAFACYPQIRLIANINRQLIDMLAENQIVAIELFLRSKSKRSFLNQLLFTKADALIVNNLGEYISATNDNGKAFHTGLLQEINFAREEILALGKPILFWADKKTNSIISNQAADLYTQRSINTVFFDYIPVESIPVTEIKNAFGEQFYGTEEYEAIELKIKLLKKQLHDAEQQDYPRRQITKNLVIPLAYAYSEIELHHEAIHLIEKYHKDFDAENAETLYSLAYIYYNAKHFQKATEHLEYALKLASKGEDDKMKGNILFLLGDIHNRSGNLPLALENYEKCLTLFLHHFEESPDNLEFKNNLGRIYSQLGDAHRSLCNLEKALEYYEKFNFLEKELHETYPDRIDIKDILAISYKKLGEAHFANRDLSKALDFTQKYKFIEEDILKNSPREIEPKNKLADSYSLLGKIHFSLGNFEISKTSFAEGRNLLIELSETYPLNEDFKNRLAASNYNLGDYYRNVQRNKQAAQFYLIEAEKLWLDLSKKDPSNPKYYRLLIDVRRKLDSLG